MKKKKLKTPPKVFCPYCELQATWIENSAVYGINLGKSYMCYLCLKCKAYVGCHNNSKWPLGTMANKELRKKRIEAHNILDWFWKSGRYKRRQVYKQLKLVFGKEIHIGSSDINLCNQIINILKILKELIT